MQTFLPSESYVVSATWLDKKRLWKQCVECKQIANSLLHGGGWAHHPAVKMWRGYEHSLLTYALVCCKEAHERGINSLNLWHQFYDLRESVEDTGDPPWRGNPDFHASHRSNLLRKDPEWYGQWEWEEPPTLPYVWPEV